MQIETVATEAARRIASGQLSSARTVVPKRHSGQLIVFQRLASKSPRTHTRENIGDSSSALESLWFAAPAGTCHGNSCQWQPVGHGRLQKPIPMLVS